MALEKIRVQIGGRTIDIDQILMHSSVAIAKWQRLVIDAQPLIGPFNSGFGIWGTPGVAIAGAAAIGFLEAVVTNANQKKGFSLLTEAIALHSRLVNRGVFMPVSKIDSIEFPDVARWKSRGIVESELDVRGVPPSKYSDLIREHGVSHQEIQNGFIVKKTEQELSVLPGEFLSIYSGGSIFQIKWSNVEIFQSM